MSEAIVDLREVNIRQGERIVLENVNFRLSPGEFCYLVGKTGSGKSSLLKTLYAALPLQEGRGQVCGFDLRKSNRHNIPQLRRQLGIVFQDYNLLTDRSVYENLRFALAATGWTDRSKMNKRIGAVLAEVDLTEKLRAMPHALSGGEQQRVAFARALLNHPKLLIADEATGNLDPETSDEILLLMRNLSRQEGCAVVFATHDYRSLETYQARIVRCHDGKVFNQEEIEM